MNKINTLLLSIFIAGIIVFVIGLYFAVIGAGIPYQDATTEMTIKYMANDLAGSYCIKLGTITAFLSLAAYIVIHILKVKKQ